MNSKGVLKPPSSPPPDFEVGMTQAANMLREDCGCALVSPSSLCLLYMEVAGLASGGGKPEGTELPTGACCALAAASFGA